MSGSRRDRRKWKRTERKRTGNQDPPKIKLHRERVTNRVTKKPMQIGGYREILFGVSLEFNIADGLTSVMVKGEKVGSAPFLAHDPTDMEYLLREQFPDLNLDLEADALSAHVSKIKALKKKCHFENQEPDFHECRSAFACPFRTWNEELNRPECRK